MFSTDTLRRKDDGGYEKKINNEKTEAQEEKRVKELTTSKLEVDLQNAKNVYSTYKFTRFAAIFGFISGLALLLLKLLEVFGILPHSK
ncbi:MAG: hypothetical protein Q8R50_14380 [Sediminibacterium sp.]|nr:hypothetical protein [Sediminibacterium sp.]